MPTVGAWADYQGSWLHLDLSSPLDALISSAESIDEGMAPQQTKRSRKSPNWLPQEPWPPLRIGLVPRTGLGVGRRAIFCALVAWLPIALPAHDHQNRDQR
jgi:hypothetical protein